MNQAVIGIGSNLQPKANIERAIKRIAESHGILSESSFVETEPLAGRDQPNYMNGAILIHTSMERQPADRLLEKEASDAFYGTDLEEQLRAASVCELIITGLQTEFCVDATCRAALSRDFDVVLVADGHTTGNSHLPAEAIIEHHNKTLANIAHPSARLRVLRADEIAVAR